jgi:zinc/manganese transport system permease protein
MNEAIELMIKPMLACGVLTAMHAYLGYHVIERGVIFVDLALAQVAALGAVIGLLLGYELHSTGGYWISLSATLTGAVIFAFSRHRDSRVPQEALIGIVYVVTAALTVILLSRSAEGGEGLKTALVGHLLFVDWGELAHIMVLYSLVAIGHWFARKPLLLISSDPEKAVMQGYRVRLWDLFFYASFGVVVTSSTELAGVLLVFSFLIIPAVCGALLAHSLWARLWVGWGVGMMASALGLWLSYVLDLPSGAAVVVCFGIIVLGCVAVRFCVLNRGS